MRNTLRFATILMKACAVLSCSTEYYYVQGWSYILTFDSLDETLQLRPLKKKAVLEYFHLVLFVF